MAASAVLSQGSSVKIKTGAGTLTKIAGVKDFDGILGGSPAVIETTDLDSVAKEKLVGVKDEGSFSITCNYAAADAGQLIGINARDTNALVSLEFAVPKQKFNFDAYVTACPITGGVDSVMEVKFTFEITGPVTKTVVA